MNAGRIISRTKRQVLEDSLSRGRPLTEYKAALTLSCRFIYFIYFIILLPIHFSLGFLLTEALVGWLGV